MSKQTCFSLSLGIHVFFCPLTWLMLFLSNYVSVLDWRHIVDIDESWIIFTWRHNFSDTNLLSFCGSRDSFTHTVHIQCIMTMLLTKLSFLTLKSPSKLLECHTYGLNKSDPASPPQIPWNWDTWRIKELSRCRCETWIERANHKRLLTYIILKRCFLTISSKVGLIIFGSRFKLGKIAKGRHHYLAWHINLHSVKTFRIHQFVLN